MNDDQTATPAKFSKGKATLLSDATEIVWHKTKMRMYGVSDSQLEELTAGYNSLHLVFFGICVGAAVTLLVAFKQLPVKSDDGPYYLAAIIATGGLAVVCGWNGLMNYRKASKRKQKLYEESIPIEP